MGLGIASVGGVGTGSPQIGAAEGKGSDAIMVVETGAAIEFAEQAETPERKRVVDPLGDPGEVSAALEESGGSAECGRQGCGELE